MKVHFNKEKLESLSVRLLLTFFEILNNNNIYEISSISSIKTWDDEEFPMMQHTIITFKTGFVRFSPEQCKYVDYQETYKFIANHSKNNNSGNYDLQKIKKTLKYGTI